MKKITIACDSSADLTKELYEKHDIRTIPFSVMLGDKEYKDGVDLHSNMIFDYVAKTNVLPKTSAINQFEFEKFFEENKSEDGLIFISISSGLSVAYQNAKKASEKFKDVYIIDSQSLSSGIGLQVLYACELRDKGLSIKEIVEKVENRRSSIQASFATYKLDYLHKGGRCSSLQLLGANLLKIRPSIIVKNGKMVMHKKYVGKMEKVVEKYVQEILEEFSTPDSKVGFITHSTATPELIKIVRDNVEKKIKFDNLYESVASATITSHCGENTIGVLYYNDGKKTKK